MRKNNRTRKKAHKKAMRNIKWWELPARPVWWNAFVRHVWHYENNRDVFTK